MCNLYTQTRSPHEIARIFAGLQMPMSFPESIPNLEPRDIAITDPGPIVRVGGSNEFELVARRWSWPGPSGKPVYNFRSDGREFGSGRVLIIADGFYEFTAPADPTQKRKDRWLFTDPAGEMIGIAGLVRDVPEVGERFTMLTTKPGSDVSPYHTRQVAVLPSAVWQSWLENSVAASELLKPAPAGALRAERATIL
jgi:putative SOS response-associated peptidase YedK